MTTKRIHKYTFSAPYVGQVHTMKMPKNAEILSPPTLCDNPCVWVLGEPGVEEEIRKFEIFMTGDDIQYDNTIARRYLGTFQLNDGSGTLHLFERIY